MFKIVSYKFHFGYQGCVHTQPLQCRVCETHIKTEALFGKVVPPSWLHDSRKPTPPLRTKATNAVELTAAMAGSGHKPLLGMPGISSSIVHTLPPSPLRSVNAPVGGPPHPQSHGSSLDDNGRAGNGRNKRCYKVE